MTMKLSDAVAAMDIASLLPAQYAAYRPLLVDALGFFLDRLSAPRQAEILAEQLELGPGADLADRFTRLLARCPTLHKLGQVVARDPRLAPALRENLQRLETARPRTRAEDVVAAVRREAGDDPRILLEPRPLAEASVAVVLPFRWLAATDADPVEGVFKILKPNVVEHLEEELSIWPALGERMEARSEAWGLAPLPYRETLETISTRLVHEVRLEREQAHLASARLLHADDPAILIPEVLPMSTPRMTAMERVHGVRLTGAAGPAEQRAAFGAVAARALLARPFWSQEPVAEFHADPHGGNLMATNDGRVAVLDWSLVARLAAAQRAAVAHATIGAALLDAGRVERAARTLGACRSEAALSLAVAEGVAEIRRGVTPGFTWIQTLLDRLATRGALAFDQELVLFRKALLSLANVIDELGPGGTIDRVLARSGLVRFLETLPGRALTEDTGAGFGTHVSNADLLRIWSDLPWTPARFWLETWRDALRVGPGEARE